MSSSASGSSNEVEGGDPHYFNTCTFACKLRNLYVAIERRVHILLQIL